MGLTLFSFLGGGSRLPWREEAFGIGGRIEDEGLVVVGRREVPAEGVAVLRPGLVDEARDDQSAGERKLSKLDPDLPIGAFLMEGILLAGDTLYGGGADVDRGFNLVDIVLVGSPFEEVDQG